MLKLYHTPISFNSRRVWVALLEKQLEFETVEIDLSGDQLQPEFLQLNPFHHIPVLVDDGFTVIESLAILDYLEAKYPEPRFLPTEPQALATVRMIELVTVNEMLPAFMPLMRQMVGLETPATLLAKTHEKIATILTFWEKHLAQGDYFVGEQFTLADIVAGTVTPLLTKFGISFGDYPHVQGWVTRLTQRPSWQQTEPTPEQVEAIKPRLRKILENL